MNASSNFYPSDQEIFVQAFEQDAPPPESDIPWPSVEKQKAERLEYEAVWDDDDEYEAVGDDDDEYELGLDDDDDDDDGEAEGTPASEEREQRYLELLRNLR